MSPFVLYLFFMLDGFRSASDLFLGLSSAAMGGGLVVFCISFMCIRFDAAGCNTENAKNAKEWSERWVRVWKWWRRILIPVFCVSLAFNIFLPNTKQAVAIYVIPKVINAAAQNKELMELPQDVVRVAKLYLNKMMVKWSEEIQKDLSSGHTDSAQVVVKPDSTSTPIGQAEQAVKDAKDAYDKALQAVEAAKKVIK